MKIRRSAPERRTCDGIVFDSIDEMEAYRSYKYLQAAGKISKLQYEPEFVFIVNGVRVGSYKPDFVFLEDGAVKVKDVKGWKRSPKTGKMLPRVDRDFALRKNLMLACFGLVVEVI